MIFNQNYKEHQTTLIEALKRLHQLTDDIGNEELSSTVSDIRDRAHEPFMFVIVGEVKAGKSSFINALLSTGEEICKVAPQPMTDVIQLIMYGEEASSIDVNPFLKKIFHPVDILKEIAIVDTPGTNTIVDHHQEITERFIPTADLIVFVFESKNPYRQSAWDFFDYIHADWRKKIIFVLQQKDLMELDDLEVNTQGVADFARKKGISEPTVFAVSAKEEQAGNSNSGFSALNTYIQQNITGGKAPFLKLLSNAETAKNINEKIKSGLDLRKAQWEEDQKFRDEIKETLNAQAQKSNYQVRVLVENLVAAYRRVTKQYEMDLNKGLGVFSLISRSIRSIFSKKESIQDWLDGLSKNFERDLNYELKNRLDEGVLDIAESIQQMAKIIDLKIKSSNTILKNDHELFSNIAERRIQVLGDLQRAFSDFLKNSENFKDRDIFSNNESISTNLVSGSGVAVIGMILTAVANGAVLDITGGVLTAVGLLFAGASIGFKKRSIMSAYRSEIEKGAQRLEIEISEKLEVYIRRIKDKIDQNFDGFDRHIASETEAIQSLEDKHQKVNSELDSICQEITASLS